MSSTTTSTYRVASFLVFAAAVTACSSEIDGRPERLGRSASPIVNGVASTQAQDFAVELRQDVNGVSTPHCSASLVAKNLVLTARHCVTEIDQVTGTTVTNTFDPAQFTVHVGRESPKQRAAAAVARGKKLVTLPGRELHPDIAFVVLDRDVTGPVARLRLNGDVQVRERLDVIGYGLTETEALATIRLQRPGVAVAAVAPSATPFLGLPLEHGEFVYGESQCYGDSGGPVVAASTNTVLGVISRGTAASCVDAQSEEIAIALAPFGDLVAQAFAAAGAKPRLEGEPDPVAVVNEAGEAGDDDDDRPAPSLLKSKKKKAAEDTEASENAYDEASYSYGCASARVAPPGRAASSSTSMAMLAGLLVLGARRRRASSRD